MIKLGYNFDNNDVKNKCIAHFLDNPKAVLSQAEEWKSFAEENPRIVSDLLYWSIYKSEFHQQSAPSELNSQW